MRWVKAGAIAFAVFVILHVVLHGLFRVAVSPSLWGPLLVVVAALVVWGKVAGRARG